MTKFLGYVAGALLAILPIVNPLGAVPLVMTVAAHLPEQERLRQIRRACVYTFVMMAGFPDSRPSALMPRMRILVDAFSAISCACRSSSNPNWV